MSLQEKFQRLEAHLKKLVIGQEHLLSRMLTALLCRTSDPKGTPVFEDALEGWPGEQRNPPGLLLCEPRAGGIHAAA